MIYRRFGKTELSMPVLSFGCMRSMYTWNDEKHEAIPEHSNKQLRALIEQALSHGITHIETAHIYGSSERQLGTILPDLKRNDYILQTKILPCEDSEKFTANVKQSMKRLGVDRLDLLALHGINDHRSLWYSCRKNGCLEAARRLQACGLVDHIGFSGHGPSDIIINCLEFEDFDGFDYFNLHWYYIFDVNHRALDCAADRDIGTFIISPSDKGGYLHTPSQILSKLCTPLSPMQFNDLYCLFHKNIHTISIGAVSPDQFAEHLEILPYLEKGSRKEVDRIDHLLSSRMEKQTGAKRPDAHWDDIPPWDQIPGYVNLRLILWLYNLYRGWGMEKYSRDRYAKLDRGSAWVPGCSGKNAEKIDFSEIKQYGTQKKQYGKLTAVQIKELVVNAHKVLAVNPPNKTG